MLLEKCLIKMSGDINILKQEVILWVKEQYQKYPILTICIGGGTQINEAFRNVGFPIRKFGPLGRETTEEEAVLALDILEKNRKLWNKKLSEMGMIVNVEIPAKKIEVYHHDDSGKIQIKTIICHINGDQYVQTFYHGYDVIYIVTTPERVEEKTKQFLYLDKIKVIAF